MFKRVSEQRKLKAEALSLGENDDIICSVREGLETLAKSMETELAGKEKQLTSELEQIADEKMNGEAIRKILEREKREIKD